MARALALAALVMLPRLASAQFGLLDDGLTLQTGREMHGHWGRVLYLIPETGRFFPAYWLTYSVIWSVVGGRALAFFVVNVLVLAGLLAMLARLVRLGGGTRSAAVVAAIVFAFCGPAIEAFYTLSKGESLQLAWIGVSLLCTAASAAHARWSVLRTGWVALAALALVFAYATKETAVVLIPIALGWLAIESRSTPVNPCVARFAATYLVLAVVAGALFAALRWQFAALTLAEGSYTRAYGLHAVGFALFRTAAWLLRNFAFVLPLLVVAVVRYPARRIILYAIVWMVGWLGVYLPWPATFEYHLLAFAFAAALLAGIVAADLWTAPGRWAARAVLFVSVLLWCVATVNAATDARVQLAVDRANADVVDFLGGLPPNSRVVLNMEPRNEYYFELPMHLAEIEKRPDIVFVPRGAQARGDFVLTPEMANQPGPTVRIALHEAGVRRDNSALATLAAGRARVYHAVQQTDVLEVGLQRLLCRLPGAPTFDPAYCPSDRGLIYRRTFSYGWQVHAPSNARTMRHGG